MPLRGGTAPSDRGNISYQAEYPAISRSTQSWYGPAMVAWLRSAVRRISPIVASRVASWTLVSGGGGGAELGRERGQRPAVGLGDDGQIRPGGGERRAVGEIELDVDARLEPDRQVASEAAPDVEDPHHREAPGTEPAGLDPGAEPVLRLGLHGHLDHPWRRRVGRERAWRPASARPRRGADRGRPRRHARTLAPEARGCALAGNSPQSTVRSDVLDDHSPPIAEQPVGDGVAHRIHLRP